MAAEAGYGAIRVHDGASSEPGGGTASRRHRKVPKRWRQPARGTRHDDQSGADRDMAQRVGAGCQNRDHLGRVPT